MAERLPLRRVIVGTLVACLAVAIAPWLGGGQEPLAMIISGMALLLAALLAWLQPEVRGLRLGPLAIAFGALVGFALLSLLWSVNRYSTAVWVTQWVMAGLAFRLAYTLAGEARGREWALRAYLGSAGVFSVVAIGMYLLSVYDRLTGTFYWANPAAAYLIPAVLISIDRLRRAGGRGVYLWAGAVVLFGCSFLLTDSRAATLVLALMVAVYLLVAPTPRRFWIKFVFTLVLSIVLSVALSWLSTFTAHRGQTIVPGSRFAEAARGESTSVSDRLYYIRSSFGMWWAAPLGGTGAGTFADAHPKYQLRVISASTSAHNIYLQVLAELGLVGAVALATVLLWLFVGVIKGFVKSPETLPVVLGVAGLLLHFGLDIDSRYPALLMLVATLLGLVYRQWGESRGRAGWMWPAAAVLVLVPVVSLYLSGTWAIRAKVAQDDGDYELAAEDFGRASSGFIYNPDLVNAHGIDLYTVAAGGRSGAKAQAAAALDLAREGARLDPRDGQHRQLEGRVLELEGDNKAAAGAFRQALVLDPYNHPDYALDLATVQVVTGDTDGAIRTARSMLSQYPEAVVNNRSTDPIVRPSLAKLEALIGNIYLQRGDVAGARAAAKRALKLDSQSLRGRALEHQVELR